ncbi:MAG: amidohydrolase family protein [Rhodovibrionaceae bacterium]
MAEDRDALRIVDAHHHLWDLEKHFYPWLSPDPLPPAMAGDCTPIAKTYGVEDYLADAAGQNLIKSVHVEAGFDYTAPLDETRWLQELADAHDFPQGIVAKASLQEPEVEALLAAQREHRNVRGIRHMVSWHEVPKNTFIDRPDLLTDSAWLAGFALLEKYDLSFDLQVYPPQMRDAAALARAHPGTSIVLVHTGMPLDRDPESRELWHSGMKALAEQPNVTVKITGLAMFDHDWTVQSLRPYVLETIDLFGTERCMFGSNFPVDKLYSSFSAIFDAFKEITRGFSDGERQALFAENAERIYRI